MIRKEKSMRKTILVMTLAAVGMFALAGSRSAFAQSNAETSTGTTPIPDTSKINYFSGGSVATPNSTVINVTDPLESGNSTTQNEQICAMIYVFDNSERMQECCGCLITEDGLLTIAVNGGVAGSATSDTAGSLVTNPVRDHSPMDSGLIRIVTANTNGEASQELGIQSEAFVCDATGGSFPGGQYGETANHGKTWAFDGDPNTNNADGKNGVPLYNDGFFGASSGKGGATLSLTGNVRAWATHLTNSLTESAFRNDPLSQNDADNLAETCGDVQNAGSGAGVCQCGNTD